MRAVVELKTQDSMTDSQTISVKTLKISTIKNVVCNYWKNNPHLENALNEKPVLTLKLLCQFLSVRDLVDH